MAQNLCINCLYYEKPADGSRVGGCSKSVRPLYKWTIACHKYTEKGKEDDGV